MKISCLNTFLLKICLLQIIIVIEILQTNAQTLCYTPSNAIGQCIDYKECSYFTKELKQLEGLGQGIPQDFQNLINQHRCGSVHTQAIFVCCEKRFIQWHKIKTTAPINKLQRSIRSVPEIDKQKINENGLKILEAIQCGEIQGNRVSRANKTKLNEFPFMALLKYESSNVYRCGAVIITNRFVLTAAHCWIDQSSKPYGVRLGEYDYNVDIDCTNRGKAVMCNPPVEDYGIKSFFAHPLYEKREIHHDIGLILLDREVVFKVHIQPVCLPIYADSQNALITDEKYTIAGWGTTHNESSSSLLLKAELPIHDNEYCAKIFSTYEITAYHICAGGENMVDSCKGDSGGPLFSAVKYNENIRYVQQGIISHGVNTCGKTEYPEVYTKVVPYLPWLTDTIANNGL